MINYNKRKIVLFSIVYFCLMAACSSGNNTDYIPPTNPTPTPVSELKMTTPEYVFNFIGQNRYSYCPSVLLQDDGSVHVFFCGNPQANVMVDNVYHIAIDKNGNKTQEESVLQPGESGLWDDHHTCDPSVIEGNFKMDGIAYKYAMFYLGNPYKAYYNEIGVAFSNDLNATEWVKYPKQLICKTWSGDGDQIISGTLKSWGVGQPSAVSLDKNGKVLLTYTAGDISGTRILWSELDMSDMDNVVINTPKTMVSAGLKTVDNQSNDYTCNSDIAIDQAEDKILIIRPVQPMPNTYPNFLNSILEVDYMNLSDFMDSKGTWTPLYRITPDNTGYPRNHNAAILRDNYGYVKDWKHPTFYYTISKAAPDVKAEAGYYAEWTYQIWRSSIANL